MRSGHYTKTLHLKFKKCPFKIAIFAISNEKYIWGLHKLEDFSKQFNLTENEKYLLALLYDHSAMYLKKKSCGKEQSAKLINIYLKKAEKLYREILESNPRYFHALLGIGRVFSFQNNYRNAIKYQIEAYRKMITLPKNTRGALGVGSLFKELGDIRSAELWYIKEYRACKRNDFGTTYNLFHFYNDTKDYRKALPYAQKLKKIIKEEFSKTIYEGSNMLASRFVISVKKEINEFFKTQRACKTSASPFDDNKNLFIGHR